MLHLHLQYASKITKQEHMKQKIEAFAKDLFDKSPEPTPVIDTVIKLVRDKSPKFNYPVGKGASIMLGLQHFAYKTFEKAIIKNINNASF
jgi:hypothetical protein